MSDEIKPIAMPKWGMEMSEGEINAWHVKIGDQVNIENDLVDVETAKIINTVTASASGIVRAILAEPGETHDVGALLGVIASADTSEEDIKAFISNYVGNSEIVVLEEEPAMSDSAEKPSNAKAENTSNLETAVDDRDDSHIAASPVARRLASEYGINLNNVTGTGRHGRVSKGDVEAAVTAAGGRLLGTNDASPSRAPSGDDSHVKATPVARRLAEQLGINLLECRVSGERGRVCKADVEAAAALKNKLPAQQTTIAPTASRSESQPITGMRKTIAVNSETKISVNDFIIKACASALIRVPALNVQFDGEQITHFSDADISVAVAIKDGLITPIISSANQKGLESISHEMRDLSTRAKLNRLKPEEFQGGNFCIMR